MGEISKVFDKITTKKEKLITVEQAFNYLKNLDTSATNYQIATLLIQLSNTIPFVQFDDIKEKFISISDTLTKDLRTYLSYVCDGDMSNLEREAYFQERLIEYQTRPPFLFPEEMYGWEDSDFYRFLKSKGLKVDHNLVKEEVFIYDGVEFAKLGGVVNEIIRLNPNKAIDKEKTIEIFSKSYPSFCFNHTPEDGDILLSVVKKFCDKWGLYFPWQPLDNQNAPANNQDTQALSQEVQTLKARITELEQANQQLTKALSDSQAETSRLQSELSNRPLAGDDCLVVNLSSPYLPKEARLGLQAWIAITQNGTQDVSKVSPKQKITEFLSKPNKGLSNQGIDRISTCFNWRPTGGNPKIS